MVDQGQEKKEMQLELESAYRNKALHSRYFVATDEFKGEKSWQGLKKSGLQKKTKGMIITTQE